MAITYDNTVSVGNLVIWHVTSSLSDAYYHWYLEGSWLGVTRTGEFSLVVEDGEQAYIVCQDTTDPAYDPIANAPSGYPARRTLSWVASADSDIDYYRVEQNKDAGGWTSLGTVQDDGSWYYSFTTARLADLSSYQFRVVPVDEAGNDGTAITWSADTIVRRPDAVDFDVTFNSPATTVTFSEAS